MTHGEVLLEIMKIPDRSVRAIELLEYAKRHPVVCAVNGEDNLALVVAGALMCFPKSASMPPAGSDQEGIRQYAEYVASLCRHVHTHVVCNRGLSPLN